MSSEGGAGWPGTGEQGSGPGRRGRRACKDTKKQGPTEVTAQKANPVPAAHPGPLGICTKCRNPGPAPESDSGLG